MNEQTIVYVWSQKRLKHLPTAVENVVCPECGNRYRDDTNGEKFWIDGGTTTEEFLQCECGEQFTTRDN